MEQQRVTLANGIELDVVDVGLAPNRDLVEPRDAKFAEGGGELGAESLDAREVVALLLRLDPRVLRRSGDSHARSADRVGDHRWGDH